MCAAEKRHEAVITTGYHHARAEDHSLPDLGETVIVHEMHPVQGIPLASQAPGRSNGDFEEQVQRTGCCKAMLCKRH